MRFFEQPNQDGMATLVKWLSDAYDNYKSVDWAYGRSALQAGNFVLDGCIESSDKLKIAFIAIGNQLIQNPENPEAKKACALFDHLYNNGFKDGLFKAEIQKQFKEIAPSASIQRVERGETSMSDFMQAQSMIASVSMSGIKSPGL